MIKIKDLSVSFTGQQIFEDVNININPGEKVGLIGRNGTGKSTFFKILMGQVEQDEGEIQTPNGYKIGYLQQHLEFSHTSLLDEVCSVLPEEREYERWKGEEILMGLGFSIDDMEKNPVEFSGGYQIKINLAKLLLNEPNILLLDEPTNYLDIHSIRWLKKFLKNWDQEIILITHDKNFMNSIINHTILIHRGHFRKSPGNTDSLLEKITSEEEIYNKTAENQAKKRKETEEWINKFRAKASTAKRAQSKMKLLEKTESLEMLSDLAILNFVFNFEEYNSAEKPLISNKISFGYPNKSQLIKNLSIKIDKMDKICIIGKNGKGKSTLLKLLNQDLMPDEGEVEHHYKTKIGYFGQMNIDRLDPTLSVVEEMQKDVPDLNQTEVYKTCGKMMFSGELSKKKIKVLSGGEKSRVMLGKILLKPANLLMLDEPTNHLDMDSCEALMNALKTFKGAIIMVTHDEHILYNVANKLIVFDNDEVSVFDGGYKDFLKKVGWKHEK